MAVALLFVIVSASVIAMLERTIRAGVLERQLRRQRQQLELMKDLARSSLWEFALRDGLVRNAYVAVDDNLWATGFGRTEAKDFPTVLAAGRIPAEYRQRIIDAIQACVDGETPEFHVDFQIEDDDGSPHWRHMRGRVHRAPDGTAAGFFGAAVDITELKRAETEVRHLKERQELALSGSQVSVWDFTLQGEDVRRSRLQDGTNVWALRGHDGEIPTTDLASSLALIMPPEEQERMIAAIEACVRGETPDFQVEYRANGYTDGRVTWRLARGKVLRDGSGVPYRFVGTSVDVTRLKHAEEEKRIATEHLHLATKMSGIYVWTVDVVGPRLADARATFINMRDSLGYDVPAESLDFASSVAFLILPEDQDIVIRRVEACLAGQTAQFEAEYRVRRGDGSIRWNLGRGIVRRDPAGAPVRLIGTSVDITELKRVEEESRKHEERLRLAVLGSRACTWDYEMPDGSLANSRPTYTNVWESLGYDAADSDQFAAGLAALIHPDDQRRFATTVEAFLEGPEREWEIECRVRHKDGSDRWHLARGTVARDATDGRPKRFTGSSIDITDRKRIEGELQRAREAAESANRAKDDFLANVSHEIRTPMNAILGMTELALDAARSDHQRQLLSTVESAARNLLGIIDDLLDFSKIAAGKLVLDRTGFSLRTELGDTLRAVAARAHQKGLELICHVHPDVPDALFGDAGRLRQVLMNLLGNAIKFTARGEVVLEVRTVSSTDPAHDTLAIVFSVRDTGIGIAREKQAAVFRAFEQEDSSTTRRYGGTGLGLTISAQLVALMGGEITVESVPGRGSTFSFAARFARSSRQSIAASRSTSDLPENVRVPGAGPTALHILVAEDNELNVALLKELLGQRGHRVRFAADGRAGLALALEELFDVFLLDLHMPEMDGFAVLSAIRERERLTNQHLPIIALTARSSSRDRERCFEAGVDDFVSKPIEPGALWAAVDRVVATFPPKRRDARLLDPRAILRTCGGQTSVLASLCEVLRRSLPDQMARARSALADGHLLRLREAAHMLYGTLAAFSTIAGAVALSLEESAQRGELESCTELIDRLESMCVELLEDTRTLSLSGLGQ